LKNGAKPIAAPVPIHGTSPRPSSVFDHSHGGDGPPILFETMAFGGGLDNFTNRCSTWEEAEAMQNEAVNLVRTGHLKVAK
jgi:hypothetical protein